MSGFVNGIGGPGDKGASITNVNIPQKGLYILSFKYASGATISPLKIDVNGIDTGIIYNLPNTIDWSANNALTFTLPTPIMLNSGNNTFKFHGDGTNWGPDMGTCMLTLMDNKLIIDTSQKGVGVNKFNFSGGWNDGTGEIWTTNTNSTFSLNFNGTGIYIMGIKEPNHGVYQISIDNGSFIEVDGYSPIRTGVISIFYSGLLKDGNHTLNFKLKGINTHGGRGDGQLNYIIVNLSEQNIVEAFDTNSKIINDFTENWRFALVDNFNFTNNYYDDSIWRKVTLPHDWSIEFNFNKNSKGGSSAGFLDGGVGWYRKGFTLSKALKGKKIFISFDGVYVESEFYVNETKVGDNQNGFVPFNLDITNFLKFDGSLNIIAIKVSNPLPSCRWYSGSGIYRNVRLIIKNNIYIPEYGTFITTPTLESDLASGGKAKVNIKTTIKNESSNSVDIAIISSIYDQNENKVSQYTSTTTMGVGSKIVEQNLTVNNPSLWDVYKGNTYKVVIDISKNNVVVDTYKVIFGFRYFKFDSNTGFWLNGNNLKIKGVCVHHDLGALGSAINNDAIFRQIKIIKSMGANAIRLTHNPSSPEYIKVCENEGILLVEEAFDCWEISKRKYDYGRFFNEYAKRDLQRMIDRSKNSPAIILWSIGNEIIDTGTSKGVTIAKNLVSWIKEIDTTRPITMGEDKYRTNNIDGDPGWNDNINAVMDVLDLVGYNYSEKVYDVHHKAKPNWKMYGSEVSSAVRSRGVYLDSTNTLINDNSNLQVTSYDNYNPTVYWGRSAEEAWKRDRDRQFIAGSFFWTAFDYIGEPTPFDNTYPAKSSYFGAIDTAGIFKDAYYLYKSQWTTSPMVHILPHWNWSQGNTVLVWVYSNIPNVELFLNNNSLGQKSFLTKKTNYGLNYLEAKDGKLYLQWQVPYQSGTLKAIATQNGVIVAQDIVTTASSPSTLSLVPDKQFILADGKSLSYVTVDVLDSKGNIVPTANNSIKFSVLGGNLVGVDNGNPSSTENLKSNTIKAFNGKALAIIQSTKLPGVITLNATLDNLSKVYTTTIIKSTSIEANNVLTNKALKINTSDKGSGLYKFKFSSGWNDGTEEIWTNNMTDTFSITFIGNKIILIGFKDPNHGVYEISIDNGSFVEVDSYSSIRIGEQIIFDSGTLSYGIHTLNFKLKGVNPYGGRPDGQISYAMINVANVNIPVIGETIYDFNNGYLSNGAVVNGGYEFEKFVGWIGGPIDGSLTIIVNVNNKGIYNLAINYISGNDIRVLKIDVNGMDTGTIYKLPITSGWEINNALTYKVPISLEAGYNFIKFHGDGTNYGADLGSITLSSSATKTFDSSIGKTTVTLYGAAMFNGEFIDNIGGYGNGEVQLGVSVPYTGEYDFAIEYVAINNSSKVKIDVNGVNTNEIYSFNETKSLDKNSKKVKVIKLNLVEGSNIIKVY
ncbi:MAG: glycoside hydrolase family 2 TIM barrel-domain containing protein [Sarcina sp.]